MIGHKQETTPKNQKGIQKSHNSLKQRVKLNKLHTNEKGIILTLNMKTSLQNHKLTKTISDVSFMSLKHNYNTKVITIKKS